MPEEGATLKALALAEPLAEPPAERLTQSLTEVPSEPTLSGSTLYRNREEWEISYNDDGLPTRIVIHRRLARGG